MPSAKAHRRAAKPRRTRILSEESGLNGYRSVLNHAGKTTHVLVPIEEYEKLVLADMAKEADRKLNDPNTEWVDAADLAAEFARDAIVEARKKAGLTQKELGKKLGLPQSQISRVERNPDRTTVRTLRKMAKALNVSISSFLRAL